MTSPGHIDHYENVIIIWLNLDAITRTEILHFGAFLIKTSQKRIINLNWNKICFSADQELHKTQLICEYSQIN